MVGLLQKAGLNTHRHNLEIPANARTRSCRLSSSLAPSCLSLGGHWTEGISHAFLVKLLRSLGQLIAGHVPEFLSLFAHFQRLRKRRFSRSDMGRAWITKIVPSSSST